MNGVFSHEKWPFRYELLNIRIFFCSFSSLLHFCHFIHKISRQKKLKKRFPSNSTAGKSALMMRCCSFHGLPPTDVTIRVRQCWMQHIIECRFSFPLIGIPARIVSLFPFVLLMYFCCWFCCCTPPHTQHAAIFCQLQHDMCEKWESRKAELSSGSSCEWLIHEKALTRMYTR